MVLHRRGSSISRISESAGVLNYQRCPIWDTSKVYSVLTGWQIVCSLELDVKKIISYITVFVFFVISALLVTITKSGKPVFALVGTYYNYASGISCDTVCSRNEGYCVGTSNMHKWDPNGDGACAEYPSSCTDLMTAGYGTCGGYQNRWNQCTCSSRSIKVNEASGKSCNQICGSGNCVTVGNDSLARNGLKYQWDTGGNGCNAPPPSSCSDVIREQGANKTMFCGGRHVEWTNCWCETAPPATPTPTVSCSCSGTNDCIGKSPPCGGTSCVIGTCGSVQTPTPTATPTVTTTPTPIRGTCTDSDGGLNYYVKGVVTHNGVEIPTDWCKTATTGIANTIPVLAGRYLNEGICPDAYTFSTVNYECPNDCYDGACLSTLTQTPTPTRTPTPSRTNTPTPTRTPTPGSSSSYNWVDVYPIPNMKSCNTICQEQTPSSQCGNVCDGGYGFKIGTFNSSCNYSVDVINCTSCAGLHLYCCCNSSISLTPTPTPTTPANISPTITPTPYCQCDLWAVVDDHCAPKFASCTAKYTCDCLNQLPTVTPTPSGSISLTPTPTIPANITVTPSPTTNPNISPTVTPSQPPISVTPTITPPASCTPCVKKNQGDADCNEVINGADYTIWKSDFLTGARFTNGCPASDTADFNNNGRVDLQDFEIWRKNSYL